MRGTSTKTTLTLSVIVLTLILLMIPVSSILTHPRQVLTPTVYKEQSNTFPTAQPYYTWQDNFNTQEYIEPGMSNNYELVDGFAQIKNTYAVWTDPAWTRMLPVTITNNQGQPITDLAVQLNIPYDSDMDPDYADIRFKHEDYEAIWLDYWIETSVPSYVKVWVRIPSIPVGDSMLYIFYGNPSATDESDFYAVFTQWEEKWANDEQLSYHMAKEGAWDPDVAFGDNVFLVAWEEGQAPYPPYTFMFLQEIRASIYDTNGQVVNGDFTIRTGTAPYRHENPSVAYGDDTFFVAWEYYGTPNDVTTMDIFGRLVSPSGTVGNDIYICTASSIQADPNVAYDSENNRFLVVWEDAREGVGNYDLYGQLISTSGNKIGGEITISDAANAQCEPWIAYNPTNEQYLIAWEEGETAANGPYDIYVGLYDKDLNLIGPGSGSQPLKVADGTSSTDYIYPCVCYSNESQRYLVTWNDADVSTGQYNGNVWGVILDNTGAIVVSTFQIRQGQFKRTDIAPYLSSSFLVSYDCGSKLWGKVVSSEGEVFSNEIQISASSAAIARKGNLAYGNNKIFATWQDKRIVYPSPWNGNPDTFCNIWRLKIPTGNEVTTTLGQEKKLLLTAQLTSKGVEPEDLISWYQFDYAADGTIFFDILDEAGSVVIDNASSGEDLTGIDPVQYPILRLQAHFSRTNPSYSPTLDHWNLTYVGVDDVPPQTTIEEIIGTQGTNGWYLSNVNIRLDATDGIYGTGVNHTYFTINNSAPIEYDDNIGIKLPPNDPNKLFGSWEVWYWSIDRAGNEESPQGPVTINIDKAAPYCQIWTPPDRATVNGDFWVQVNASDYGSGINYILFDTGPPYENPVKIYTDDPPGSGNYKWLCTRHYVRQWKHLIAQVYDNAGHMYEHNIWIHFSNRHDGLFHPGYIYLFANHTIGPRPLMLYLQMALAVDFTKLYVRVQSWNTDGVSAEFTVKRLLLPFEETYTDSDLTDGCSTEIDVPWGFYEITVDIYDDEQTLIEEQLLIKRMLILLIA